VSPFLFFFQAEDGIRVFHVTGVQTCALPIYCTISTVEFSRSSASKDTVRSTPFKLSFNPFPCFKIIGADIFVTCNTSAKHFSKRSEERRVGKECSSLCATNI